MVDALNMLELEGIPLVTAIDEHGTAHSVTSESIEEEFVARDFVPPQQASEPVLPQKPDLPSLESATEAGGAEAWGEYGAALYAWGGIERVDEAVAAFRHAVSIADVDGRWHFRLGVCLRRRYDSTYRQVSDFQEAVDEWGRALALDPNQYIWRRRIQQYGPRLDKPYPFYDWIVQAREEIEARGGSPVRLVAEPVGAEYAEPLAGLVSGKVAEDPDPEGDIERDGEGFVRVEVVTVPASVRAGESARIHVIFNPDIEAKVHWNNEAEDLRLWIDPVDGWNFEQSLHTVSSPADPVSRETRRLDFEAKSAEGTQPGDAILTAHALYYVCEDVNGTCLYRRQDMTIGLRVVEQDAR